MKELKKRKAERAPPLTGDKHPTHILCVIYQCSPPSLDFLFTAYKSHWSDPLPSQSAQHVGTWLWRTLNGGRPNWTILVFFCRLISSQWVICQRVRLLLWRLASHEIDSFTFTLVFDALHTRLQLTFSITAGGASASPRATVAAVSVLSSFLCSSNGCRLSGVHLCAPGCPDVLFQPANPAALLLLLPMVPCGRSKLLCVENCKNTMDLF